MRRRRSRRWSGCRVSSWPTRSTRSACRGRNGGGGGGGGGTGSTGAGPPLWGRSRVGMSRVELADAFDSVGVPEPQRRMRVEQVWNWLYVRGATDFAQMTSVSKELRAALAEKFTLARP